MRKNARQYFSRANTDFETAFCGTRRRSYVDVLRRVLESNDPMVQITRVGQTSIRGSVMIVFDLLEGLRVELGVSSVKEGQ